MTLGEALRELLKTDEAYAILGKRGGTWTAGGCWILGDALVLWAGPLASRYVITGGEDGRAHHMVIRLGDLYFDGDGASTKRTLLRRWEEVEGVMGVDLEEWDKYRHEEEFLEGGVPCPVAKIRKILALLRRELGTPADWKIPPRVQARNRANPSRITIHSGMSMREAIHLAGCLDIQVLFPPSSDEVLFVHPLGRVRAKYTRKDAIREIVVLLRKVAKSQGWEQEVRCNPDVLSEEAARPRCNPTWTADDLRELKVSLGDEVPLEEVIRYIDLTNVHQGTPRDTWNAVPVGFRNYGTWRVEEIPLSRLHHVEAWSARDAKRYAEFTRKHGPMPPIVATADGDSVSVIDGAHRVQAARLLGLSSVIAIVGRVAEPRQNPTASRASRTTSTSAFGRILDRAKDPMIRSWPAATGASSSGRIISNPLPDLMGIIARLGPRDRVVALAKPMDWARLESDAQRWKQDIHNKPMGFWYSCGPNWLDWLRYESQKRLDSYNYLYQLDLDLRMLAIIRSQEDAKEFDDAYRVFHKESGVWFIDWALVARDFAGIEVCPYEHWWTGWLEKWDVPSGAIWDLRAIRSIKRIVPSEGTP